MSYPILFGTPGVKDFAEAVDVERGRQLAKFGDQHHPDGTGMPGSRGSANLFRELCQYAAADGSLSWRDIASEEFFEAMAETEWPKLRTELIQLAAVLAAWVHDGDNRAINADTP